MMSDGDRSKVVLFGNIQELDLCGHVIYIAILNILDNC